MKNWKNWIKFFFSYIFWLYLSNLTTFIFISFIASDYHLFWSMQDSCFKTLDDVRKFVDNFIASKSASFFHDGICMLPDRWRKVIGNNGQYFEDWSDIHIFYNINYYLEKKKKISYTPYKLPENTLCFCLLFKCWKIRTNSWTELKFFTNILGYSKKSLMKDYLRNKWTTGVSPEVIDD